jgi:hypothetical protein
MPSFFSQASSLNREVIDWDESTYAIITINHKPHQEILNVSAIPAEINVNPIINNRFLKLSIVLL